MRAMDYIKSTDICYLICDTLSLIDKRPIEHGMRVAYMMMKLLENKGGYDEYEAAEFVFLTMLHDIGAYKTERMLDERMYDAKGTNPAHAVYGALFLKNVSPFGDRADILLYHHLPFTKINQLNYEYNKIAGYLSLLEDVDALYCKDGENLDLRTFEKGAGDKYSTEAVMLLLRCARMDGMLKNIKSGEYKAELYRFMENILFTNEEKENYIRFIVQCFGLKEKILTVKAIMCCSAADEVAEDLGLTNREKEKLDYATMLHDIGLLSAEAEVLKTVKEFSEGEKSELDDHIETGMALLKKYFIVPEIVETAAVHHERLDGSGYPEGLRDGKMTVSQKILQTVDLLIVLMNQRKNGQALSKDEIMNILLRKADRKQLDGRVVAAVMRCYDMIERKVRSETKDYLEMYVRIHNRYKRLTEDNIGE